MKIWMMTNLEVVSGVVDFESQVFYHVSRENNNCIEFDIAVTIENKKTNKGKGEITSGIIKVIGLGINLAGEHEKLTSGVEVSRIKFSIQSKLIERSDKS